MLRERTLKLNNNFIPCELQAEKKAGFFEIIDGRHRMEKALRVNLQYIDSYKLNGEQLLDYFIDKKGYRAFIGYWNDWLKNGY